jgi:hypothetical protein
MRVESAQWHIAGVTSKALWMVAFAIHTLCLKVNSLTTLCASGLWSASFAKARAVGDVVWAANDFGALVTRETSSMENGPLHL